MVNKNTPYWLYNQLNIEQEKEAREMIKHKKSSEIANHFNVEFNYCEFLGNNTYSLIKQNI